ncbi:MAG: ABC transporter ATP-binding protein [Alphaproteobacteria bacterium]|nr:ABC transporter ATP-binding protein [Alphaproteobacteria bacterium]
MASPLLEIENTSKRFGGLEALRSVTLQLTPGRIYGLIGPNGAGKTTLFNVITGVSAATTGIIRFQGHDITRAAPHEIARLGIARTYQLVRPFQELSALENVEVGIFFGQGKRHSGHGDALTYLERVGLARKAHYPVTELNLGERKRLEIARALAADPRLLLFDEVLAGLNPTEAGEAVELFQTIRTGGATILMIEHNMQAIMRACDQIIVLHHGELIAYDTPQRVSADPKVIEAYLGQRDLKLERRRRMRAHAPG